MQTVTDRRSVRLTAIQETMQPLDALDHSFARLKQVRPDPGAIDLLLNGIKTGDKKVLRYYTKRKKSLKLVRGRLEQRYGELLPCEAGEGELIKRRLERLEKFSDHLDYLWCLARDIDYRDQHVTKQLELLKKKYPELSLQGFWQRYRNGLPKLAVQSIDSSTFVWAFRKVAYYGEEGWLRDGARERYFITELQRGSARWEDRDYEGRLDGTFPRSLKRKIEEWKALDIFNSGVYLLGEIPEWDSSGFTSVPAGRRMLMGIAHGRFWLLADFNNQ